MSLGEAAIVLVRRQGTAVRTAIGNTINGTLALICLGIPCVVLCAVALIQPTSRMLWVAIGLTAVLVAIETVSRMFSMFLHIDERIVATSVAFTVTSASAVLGLVLFVVVLDLDLAGAMLASVAGVAAGLLTVWTLLRRSNTNLRPFFDREYLGRALRYGAKLQASQLVMLAAARADLLLVFALAGQTQAGYYSVALAFAMLVTICFQSLSNASFPRLAGLRDDEARMLIVRLSRLAFAAGIYATVALGALAPSVLPFVFGEAFAGARWPAVILVGGGLFFGGQILLARAAAARGRVRALLVSFGTSTAVMLALDFLLVPMFGATGAAIASLVAAVVGFAVCLATYRRWDLGVFELGPRPSDFARVLRPIRLLRSIR